MMPETDPQLSRARVFLLLLSLGLLLAPFQAFAALGQTPDPPGGLTDIGRQLEDMPDWLVYLVFFLLMVSLLRLLRRRGLRRRLNLLMRELEGHLVALSRLQPTQGLYQAYMEPGRRALASGERSQLKEAFLVVGQGLRHSQQLLAEHNRIRELFTRAQAAFDQCCSAELKPDPALLEKARKALHQGQPLSRVHELASQAFTGYGDYLAQGRLARKALARLAAEIDRARVYVAVDQARNSLDQARAAFNTGDAGLTLKLTTLAEEQLRSDLAEAQPQLVAQLERELPLGLWHKLKLKVSNLGRAHARDVRLRFEGVESQPMATIETLTAGESRTLEVAFRANAPGTLPYTVVLTGSRLYDNGLVSNEQSEWLEVGRPTGPASDHPGWRARQPPAPEVEGPIELLRETEFYRGYVRVKVAALNQTATVVTDAAVELHFDELAFRLDRTEPEFRIVGAKALLGNLNPGQKRALAFYLDPLICTTSQLDGTLAFKDVKGQLHLAKMRPKLVEVICPMFFTPEVANTATLIKLVKEELPHSDSRIFSLPGGLAPAKAFDLAREVLGSRDIGHVHTLKLRDPYKAEAWYYGATKVKAYQMAIRVVIDEATNSLELFCAAPAQEPLTGLLAELGADLKKRMDGAGWPVKRITNITIRDSILNRSSLLLSNADIAGGEVEEQVNIHLDETLVNRSRIEPAAQDSPTADEAPSLPQPEAAVPSPTESPQPSPSPEVSSLPEEDKSRLEVGLKRLREVERLLEKV